MLYLIHRDPPPSHPVGDTHTHTHLRTYPRAHTPRTRTHGHRREIMHTRARTHPEHCSWCCWCCCRDNRRAPHTFTAQNALLPRRTHCNASTRARHAKLLSTEAKQAPDDLTLDRLVTFVPFFLSCFPSTQERERRGNTSRRENETQKKQGSEIGGGGRSGVARRRAQLLRVAEH